MIFDNINVYREEAEAETTDIDLVVKDPETEAGQQAIADEVEANMQQAALENVTYFNNGEEALREFCQSEEAQVLVESRRMSKRTFVRLGKTDDLQRRKNMACLILAREHKDPLFFKLAKNRVMERRLRNEIYKRYGNKADRVAKLSQKKHIKDMQKMKALPAIKFN